ncbi:ribonuclease P protein component [Microcella putealis]|uniref:ribonuclease P protein component n=1 Tax=Microcella putealis TaxID=337005 RepID=UPI00102ADB08|nr:ribonuclease P protein component [Microcella putealis]TQM27275.1 ribonuclease P protein component [Microcella putealis]
MLDRAHRVRSSSDFRDTMRRGRKAAAPTVVVYVRRSAEAGPVRFGIITSKALGNAVTRNSVKRRARAVAKDLIPTIPDGTAVVMRMLPAAAEVDWATLREHVTATTRRAVSA